MASTANHKHVQPPPGPAAVLAEFETPEALLSAAERVRDAGYRRWDTHTPFPVHGIDQAMGIRMTRLPWIIFVFGVLGCAGGLGLQWWTNAAGVEDLPPGVPVHFQGYDFRVSGKPLFSLPANIPVTFETTVLLAASAAVVGMLVLNNLPRHHQPLLANARFRRATTDRFYIVIDGQDPQFELERTRGFLATLGAAAVEPVEVPRSPDRWPRPMVYGGLILAALLLLPPLAAYASRNSLSTKPRIQIVQDMDNQERFKPQQVNPIFADSRASRGRVPGTIARGDLRTDAHFHEGRVGDGWAQSLPPQVEVNEVLLRRGQQRFNIYCAPCHGLGGAGDGTVHKRALELGTPGWNAPTSLTDQVVREREDGNIFNTITNGIRTMPPYGDQIPVADRWAIVAYVRALQISQHAGIEDVPEELRGELR